MKRIMTLAAAALVLAACSKEEGPGSGPQNPAADGKIRIAANIDGEATSKAVYENSSAVTGIQFLRKDAQGTAPTDFSGVTAIAGDRAESGAITWSGNAPTYDKNDNNAYFAAYWPAGTNAEGGKDFTIDGKTDILLTETVYDAGKYSDPKTGTMSFQHQLARVEVKCMAAENLDAAVLAQIWGNITKIEVLETPTAMQYRYNAPTAMTAGTTTGAIVMKEGTEYNTDLSNGTIQTYTNAPTVTAGAMIAPSDGTSLKLKVYTSVVTEGKEVTISNFQGGADDGATSLAKGYVHTVTLTFDADGKSINVTQTSVDAWKTNGMTGDGTITPDGN